MLDPVLNIAIFVIWWWISLFVMLPIGARSVHEAGVDAHGHDRGAPVKPSIRKKALWAAGLALVLWAITAAVIAFDVFHIRP